MTKLIDKDDLTILMEESLTYKMTNEVFEAWGIEADAIRWFAAIMARNTILDILRGQNVEMALMTTSTASIELGYKMCLEVEQRRTANE